MPFIVNVDDARARIGDHVLDAIEVGIGGRTAAFAADHLGRFQLLVGLDDLNVAADDLALDELARRVDHLAVFGDGHLLVAFGCGVPLGGDGFDYDVASAG